MTQYLVTDIPGRPEEAPNLMDLHDNTATTFVNMGQVIQDFVGSYILARGKAPARLQLSPADTDEYAAYMYLMTQGKSRHLPGVIQGLKASYDQERTALA